MRTRRGCRFLSRFNHHAVLYQTILKPLDVCDGPNFCVEVETDIHPALKCWCILHLEIYVTFTPYFELPFPQYYAYSTGDITVTRGYAVSNTSFSDSNSFDGYTWTIVFSPGSPDAPELGVDGAALEGQRAAGNLVETQIARTPEIQRVSTSAGSAVWGGYTLEFNGNVTEELVYNATADEVSK